MMPFSYCPYCFNIKVINLLKMSYLVFIMFYGSLYEVDVQCPLKVDRFFQCFHMCLTAN